MLTVPAFHDNSRRKLVEGFLADLKSLKMFSQTQPSRQNLLVTITAPNGWGKTRLIQEFYKRLVADNEINHLNLKRTPNIKNREVCFSGYWPVDLADQEFLKKASLEEHRKLLNPIKHNNRANTLPAFMWVGYDCDHYQDLAPMEAIIDRHLDHLNDAAYFSSSNTQQFIKGLKDLAKDGIEDNFVNQISNHILSLGDVAFGGFVSSAIKKYKTNASEKASRLDRIQSDTQIDRNINSRILLKVKLFVESGIPLILCLEDFHNAAIKTVELIQEFLKLNGPILVIATATKQNEYLNANEPQDFLIKKISADLDKDSLPLAPISTESLRRIVKQYYPNTTSEEAGEIVNEYSSPLLVQLLLELPIIKRKVKDDALTYVMIKSVGVPPSVQGVYSAYFQSLNPDTRKLLVLLAVITDGKSRQWDQIIENHLKRILDMWDGKGEYEDISTNWCLRSHQGIYEFYSIIHKSICLHHSRDYFDQDDINDASKVLVERISEEPIDALDEKTILLIQGIIEQVLNSSSTISNALINAIGKTANYWVVREREYEQLWKDCLENQSDYSTVDDLTWPFDFDNLGYNIYCPYSDVKFLWKLLKSLHDSKICNDHDAVVTVITLSELILPLPRFASIETDFIKIYEDSFKIYKESLLRYDFDDEVCNFEIRNEIRSVERWVSEKIVDDVVLYGSGSSCLNYLRSACINIIDKSPEERLENHIAGSLIDELLDIKKLKHEREKVEEKANRDAKQSVQAIASEELKRIEAEVKTASGIKVWSNKQKEYKLRQILKRCLE